ncbi:MAG: hypothetical protein ACAI34_04815 [Verrucomicrobium sp.]
MLVKADTSPASWKALAPEERISREGFRPLVTRSGTAASEEDEALLEAAEIYQKQLQNEAALAEDMLNQLDALEFHLKALHGSNDSSEEMSILLSYVRLERAVLAPLSPSDADHDSEHQGLAILDGAAKVDVTRPRPTVGSQKSSRKGRSSEENEEESSDGGSPKPVEGPSSHS